MGWGAALIPPPHVAVRYATVRGAGRNFERLVNACEALAGALGI